MKKTAVVLALLLPVLLLLPSGAGAAPPPRHGGGEGGYVVFKGGFYSPESDDMDAADFDTGFSMEVALGKRVAPNLTLEGAVGYFQSEADVWFTDGFSSFPGEVRLESVPLTLTALVHPRPSNVEPYLLFGGGIYFNETTWDYDGWDDDESSASFGLHFGGGLKVHLSPGSFVVLEGKYLWAEAEDVGGQDYDIDGFRGMAGFGIKF